jgi:hypothetical protein
VGLPAVSVAVVDLGGDRQRGDRRRPRDSSDADDAASRETVT